MSRWLPLLFVALILLRSGPRSVHACGGPDYGNFSALQPIDVTLEHLEAPNPWVEWGMAQREELRFLFPFHQTDPATFDGLWRFSHGSSTTASPPSTAALDAALARADWDRARIAALDLVDALYRLPPVPAAAERATFDRALEVIDLAPHLAQLPSEEGRAYFDGQPVEASVLRAARAARGHVPSAPHANHPRQAWLAWRALRHEVATEVPNGWSSAIRRKVAPQLWSTLQAHHVGWLRNHPHHPLADQVRLDRVRLFHFADDTDPAWRLLVDLLPTRPVRALAEMRYLLLQSELPPDDVVDGTRHPLLVTAFAGALPIPPRRWARWWALSERGGTSLWATNLQVRLLRAAARAPGPLPHGFPAQIAAPTPLWGIYRAGALARQGRRAAAQAQLAALDAGAPGRARMRSRLFLDQGRPLAAATVPQIPADSRRSLLRVELTAKALRHLTTRRDTVGIDARLDLGLRIVAAGRWKDAADIVEADDPARADRWREAERLQRDSPLALARFLVRHRRTIFDGHRNGVYRGLSVQHMTRPSRRRAIEGYLERASPDWQALVAYITWLERHPRDPRAREVLGEADDAYNRLINRGGGDHFFWGRFATSHPRVKQLRRLGRLIRHDA